MDVSFVCIEILVSRCELTFNTVGAGPSDSIIKVKAVVDSSVVDVHTIHLGLGGHVDVGGELVRHNVSTSQHIVCQDSNQGPSSTVWHVEKTDPLLLLEGKSASADHSKYPNVIGTTSSTTVVLALATEVRFVDFHNSAGAIFVHTTEFATSQHNFLLHDQSAEPTVLGNSVLGPIEVSANLRRRCPRQKKAEELEHLVDRFRHTMEGSTIEDRMVRVLFTLVPVSTAKHDMIGGHFLSCHTKGASVSIVDGTSRSVNTPTSSTEGISTQDSIPEE